MIKKSLVAKGIRTYCIAFIHLAAVVLVFKSAVQAQDTSATRIAAIIKGLGETPGSFEGRLATLKNRIEQKKSYLIIIQERLRQADNETDDTTRAHKRSRYGYQAFLLTCRIAAEEVKLRETEILQSFIPRLADSSAVDRLKKELHGMALSRMKVNDQLLQKAATYRPLITETVFKVQFEQLLNNLHTDEERFKL